MNMAQPESKSILVVGAGCFGLSTALHLAQAGYSNITVLDKGSQVPSPHSAANDINKILRAEYEDPFYTDLTKKAFEVWKTPLFAPHFRQTGFLHCVSGEAPERAVATLNRFRAAAEQDAELKKHVVPIDGKEDIIATAWQYREAPLPGWHGYLNRYDGYAHSGNALIAVFQACVGLGVRFLLGEKGDVVEVVYEGAAEARKAAGVRTRAGRRHAADLVIVAAGAAANKLVPDIGQQVVAKSWSAAHVQLTDAEAAALRGIPVTYARDLGFFFEPEPRTNLLKVCPMGGGYVNTDPATGVSLPPPAADDSRFMPPADEARCRKLLAQTLPALAARPLINRTLCWFADTSDSDFIVDYVPGTARSVVLLSGDSGHGFKMFPIVGAWVKDLLRAEDGKQAIARWRWRRPAAAEAAEGDKGNWGDAVSWRLGNTEEFESVRPAPKGKL